MVTTLRAFGAAVLVLGPTPHPSGDVPDCLASHLDDAAACSRPLPEAVNLDGSAAERSSVTTAGGRYLDVWPWICTARTCPPIVGNLLVYRDDNHLTTPYVTWLAPALAAELDAATSTAPATAPTTPEPPNRP